MIKFKPIKVREETYRLLSDLRYTEKGKVSFSNVIEWLIENIKEK